MKRYALLLAAALSVPGFAQDQIALRTEVVMQDSVEDPPAIVKRVAPRYPQTAKNENAEGTVWLKVYVNERGKPASVEVLRSPRSDLAEAATEAAMRFEFTPGKVKGKPVGVWVTIPFKFTLEESETKLDFPEGSPSVEHIAMALSNLGITVQPIRYSLPYEHRIVISLEVYRNGERTATHTAQFLQRANENSLVLTLKKEDGKLTSGMSTGTASSSSSRLFPPLSFGTHKAVLYQTLDDVHLVMNKKSPFYIFAADPNEVGTISNGNADSYIKRYPLVVVFSAELKPKEGK